MRGRYIVGVPHPPSEPVATLWVEEMGDAHSTGLLTIIPLAGLAGFLVVRILVAGAMMTNSAFGRA